MVFLPIIFYLFPRLFYFDYTNISFFSRFVASLIPGVRSSGSIVPQHSSPDTTRINKNGIGKGYYWVC